METGIKIITFGNLDRAVENMYKVFTPIEKGQKSVNAEVSSSQPENQDIGDIWFVETERN